MNKKSLLLIPAALIMAGCATCNKKVDMLETRVQTLEEKNGIASPQKEAMTTTGESTSGSKEASVPDSPSKKDIQAALKNAGVYTGEVDGKMGPKTKSAIEAFQTANDLKADGKVGPNTWNKLKKYYVPETK